MTQEKIWNVPNVLTMIRMLLIPVYWALFMQGHRFVALAVFILASLTDLADGYIARKYHLITNFGKLMDPLADKLMVLSVMLSLALRSFVPWAPLIILLCKEGLMVLGGVVLLKKGVVVYAEKIGKIAQTFVVSSLVLSFFQPEFASLGCPVHLILMWIAVALTLSALVFYGRSAIEKYKAASHK
ncbi:MAG: CDP-alcohol phosphatidyltransferase family protein [Clostridiales bacterium]|nr:CDP-alcohol phosphatidyltransferase family protein [Clostridiales bacterium]